MNSDFIPYGRQSVGAEEFRRVREVLESDWLTQGPQVAAFEEGMCQVFGARFAVAMSHGTTALYLACRAAGLGPGDRFLTTPMTFVATANAGVLCGAEPVFVDIDPDTLNIDLQEVERALQADRKIKVFLPVHMGGLVCPLDEIAELCRSQGVIVIEDACHAVGSRWQDQSGEWRVTGDSSFSDMTCFSFHPVKNITTGEGGAVLTNNAQLAAQLRMLRNHGITRESSLVAPDTPPWGYEMQALSLNGRLTDFQAAIGLVQLAKLARLKRRRLELVKRYDRALAALGAIRTQRRPGGEDSTCWHLMIIRAERRAELYAYLHERQIKVQVHYLPVHTQPFYRERFCTGSGDFPVAEAYYEEALSLPLYPDLSDADQDRVVAAVKAFYGDKKAGPTEPA